MINDFDGFKKYVIENKEQLIKMTGDCNGCPKSRECHKDNKEKIMDYILDTDNAVTRFPLLLKMVKKIPNVLNLVPGVIFEKLYGFYGTVYLPCPFAAKEIVEKLDKVERVYNLLSDEQSKEIFINLLMYRMTFNRDYVLKCKCLETQYFIDEYKNLSKEEIVVDCGAYTGDTMVDYFYNNQPPKKYYIFEPGKENINAIKETIKQLGVDTEFVISEKGLYNKSTSLWFVSDNSSSSYTSEQFVENAEEIQVTSIDEDIKEDVTFIKMDIEGFERFAIEGSKQHILSSYPKLAICIYHSVNDFLEIPLMIKTLFPEYNNFIIKHYKSSCTETVFYVYRK